VAHLNETRPLSSLAPFQVKYLNVLMSRNDQLTFFFLPKKITQPNIWFLEKIDFTELDFSDFFQKKKTENLW
jgi:hypothetical protein